MPFHVSGGELPNHRSRGGRPNAEAGVGYLRSHARSSRLVVKRGSEPEFVVGLEVRHRHLWCCESLHRSWGAG